jgi:hypothetical protein
MQPTPDQLNVAAGAIFRSLGVMQSAARQPEPYLITDLARLIDQLAFARVGLPPSEEAQYAAALIWLDLPHLISQQSNPSSAQAAIRQTIQIACVDGRPAPQMPQRRPRRQAARKYLADLQREIGPTISDLEIAQGLPPEQLTRLIAQAANCLIVVGTFTEAERHLYLLATRLRETLITEGRYEPLAEFVQQHASGLGLIFESVLSPDPDRDLERVLMQTALETGIWESVAADLIQRRLTLDDFTEETDQ